MLVAELYITNYSCEMTPTKLRPSTLHTELTQKIIIHTPVVQLTSCGATKFDNLLIHRTSWSLCWRNRVGLTMTDEKDLEASELCLDHYEMQHFLHPLESKQDYHPGRCLPKRLVR